MRAALEKHFAQQRSEFSDERAGYAIVRSNRDNITVSASRKDIKQVAQLRETVGGDFLWFRDGEQAYIVRDAATLARIDEAWGPVNRLGAQMDEQGRKLDAQGKIVDTIAREFGAAGGEFAKQSMKEAEVNQRAMEQLARAQETLARRISDVATRELGSNSSPEKIRAFHEKQASLQKEMEPLRKQMAEQQRELEAKMAKLREANQPLNDLNRKIAEASRPMGELSARMAELNLKHGAALREAERAIRALMQESRQNGKAVAVPAG